MLGALIMYLKKTDRKKLFTERNYDQKRYTLMFHNADVFLSSCS